MWYRNSSGNAYNLDLMTCLEIEKTDNKFLVNAYSAANVKFTFAKFNNRDQAENFIANLLDSADVLISNDFLENYVKEL